MVTVGGRKVMLVGGGPGQGFGVGDGDGTGGQHFFADGRVGVIRTPATRAAAGAATCAADGFLEGAGVFKVAFVALGGAVQRHQAHIERFARVVDGAQGAEATGTVIHQGVQHSVLRLAGGVGGGGVRRG